MPVLQFDEIHRAYRRGQRVLDGVSIDVRAGEVVGLLGVNGAGKTTLMHLAMGMLEPQAGSVRVFGLDPRVEPLEVKRRVGFVSEDQVLPAHMRVGRVMALHRELFPTWDDALAASMVEQFGVDLDAKVNTLSKGEARKVALAAAMAHRPELLLLDEPAGGLDPAARREFLEASISYLAETGSSILFSSHHMTDVERIAGRLVMLHEGKVLLDDDIDELREGSCVAVIAAGATTTARLRQIDGCIAARTRPQSIHAVFRSDPKTTSERLSALLGVDDIRCEPVALEELFVELAGDGR